MAVDKGNLAAFAKSPTGGKKKKGPPAFGKGKDHDDEDEHGDDDEHAEDKKKAKKKKGGGGDFGEHEETDPGHDEHEDEHGDDDEHELDQDEIDEIGEQVQNGDGDKRLMKLARKVDEDHNPPQWAVDEELWEKAKDAVEDKWDEYDEPYAVVAHVYQKMGGTIG
jgi:hypothetical protein